VENSAEFRRRATETDGLFLIKLRTDQQYRDVIVQWFQLERFSQASKHYRRRTLLKEVETADLSHSIESERLLVTPIHMGPLPPGEYRITLVGRNESGALTNIDNRIFHFDGSAMVER
jgi:hypothetical protein